MAQDTSGDVWNDVEHKYADSNGVKIHYAALSPKGNAPTPLVVMIHGGPLGSWNTWHWRWNPTRNQWERDYGYRDHEAAFADAASIVGHAPGAVAQPEAHDRRPADADLDKAARRLLDAV